MKILWQARCITAKIALIEGMKKTEKLGAKYCFGGTGDFYKSIGFKEIANRELWKNVNAHSAWHSYFT